MAVFKPFADYGRCVAKKLDYYGFKLGLRITRCGMSTCCPLLPARPHDIQLLDDLVAGFAGLVPADKGFIDAFRQAVLAERHGVFKVLAHTVAVFLNLQFGRPALDLDGLVTA
jgi:hypothetical protein